MTTARERLEAANDLGHPQGAYRVELNDAATGRRLELIETPNYVSGAYARNVKWWQGAHFHRGTGLQIVDNSIAGAGMGSESLAGGMTGSTEVDWLAPPRLNAAAVILTDSAVGEDSASEWGTGRTIAYGTRWKTTIAAAGKRGQINEAQSLVSADVVRLVWDFNETQGNGTFRSLNLGDVTTYGDLVAPPTGYNYRWEQPTTGESIAIPLTATGMNSAGTELYGITNEATSAVALYKILLTGGTDNGDHYVCDPPVKIATLAGLGYNNYGQLTTIGQNAPSAAVVPVGSDFLVCWGGFYGQLFLGRYNAAGVEAWKVELLPAVTAMTNGEPSITTDGTYAYIATGRAVNNTFNHVIHRVDLATQAIDATYTLGDGYPGSVGLLGTDLIVGYADSGDLGVGLESPGLYRLNSGGSFVEYYGNPWPKTRGDYSVSPWNGQQITSESINAERDYDLGARFNANYSGGLIGGTGAGDLWNIAPAGRVLVGNGKLWQATTAAGGQTPGTVYRLYQLGGSNIYSRTVLAANQAKSSSQTMQITYELTLPSEWRGRAAHVAPPT